MPEPADTILLAAFDDPNGAGVALDALAEAGFATDRLGLIAPDIAAVFSDDATDSHAGAWNGILTGGIAGGILATAVSFAVPGVGPLLAAGVFATFLGGTAAGAAAGGLMGAMSDLDVSDNHVDWSQRQLLGGKTLVSVRPGARSADAAAILQRYGGRPPAPDGDGAACAPAPPTDTPTQSPQTP